MSKFVAINQNQDEHQVIINIDDVSNIVRAGKYIYVSFLSHRDVLDIKITDGEEKQVMQELSQGMRE